MERLIRYHIEFVITAFLALVVWSIRLEGRVNNAEEKIQLVGSLQEKISEIRESLARIEGQLRLSKD